jgi:retron-type reverse transcriptase
MEVMAFRNNLDDQLSTIHRQLLDGTFSFGHYHFFTIFDPKRRTICAASFPERVVFHAMMRICHPVFDNYQIYDSYASRIGKGTYKALERTQHFCRQYHWFAKLDMCKYFDSIHHAQLFSQLCRLFKDPQLLLHFRHLLDTYETRPSCGLPIGNLTSQYFANHYLSPADHFAKEQMRVPAMVRYMDDVLLFGNDLIQLKQQVEAYTHYVERELKLQVHPPIINQTRRGIPFLGYVVYVSQLRLNQRSRHRFLCKMSALDRAYWLRLLPEREVATRSLCLLAFAEKANCHHLYQKLYQQGQYS